MKYNQFFYDDQMDGSLSSAQVIIPILLKTLSIKSAIDVGCGVGTWLSALKTNGVSDILGMDGDYIDRATLKIPQSSFCPSDLFHPVSVDRKFDLAISLEVAEHLPETRAASFVEDLTHLADCVLFSAAIPGQYGTNHLNEQWQSYWAKIFAKNDYAHFDLFRPIVWTNRCVEVWYRQNILLYAKQNSTFFKILKKTIVPCSAHQLDLVHPSMYMQAHNMPTAKGPDLLKWLFRRTYSKLKQEIKRS